MGMVVVISLPFILFSIMLGVGCYFFGRYKGRQDIRTNPQVFGVPTPPPAAAAASAFHNKSDDHHVKPTAAVDNVSNVV
ncbi:hypothetical protein LINGRAPRIM_LOCUS321 [Linum grandiflorum]